MVNIADAVGCQVGLAVLETGKLKLAASTQLEVCRKQYIARQCGYTRREQEREAGAYPSYRPTAS